MLTSDEDVDSRFREFLDRRERFRKRILVAFAVTIAVLLVLLGIAAMRFASHLGIASQLHSKGLMVDWYWDKESIWNGGYNEVRYHFIGRYEMYSNLTRDDVLKLHKLTRITLLDLTDCTELGDAELDTLGKFTDLVDLRLDRLQGRSFQSKPHALTDKILDQISTLTNLRTLSLAGLPITDANIAKLANLGQLEDLDLDGSKVTDASLPLMGKLPKLKYLRLADTKVTAEGISILQRSAPNVTVLRVSDGP